MKLLIDECLHTSLTGVAHDAGYACDHVNFLGLSGYKDWQLIGRIHPGLIIIVPNVVPRLQRELLRAALAHIGDRELVNTVLEVDLTDAGARCREFPCPRP